MTVPANILVLAPHTDDGELGCGASLARYVREGSRVSYAAFSLCRKSLLSDLPPDTLEKECRIATRELGIDENQLFFFDFEVRTFDQQRQAILEEMVQLNKLHHPDLVFIPSASDQHQDHQVIHTEAQRAFKHCSLLGYELPWNHASFRSTYFIPADEECLLKKVKAVQSYHSQSHRNYMSEEFIRSLAKVRGVQCNQLLAEAFEVYRLIE